MAIKKIEYRPPVQVGEVITYPDELHFKTSSDVVMMGDGNDLETNFTALDNAKVDKVEGKGLSANDYTTTEKNKLGAIEAQANKTTIVNTLTETVTGKALDATQGKALDDKIGVLSTLTTTQKTNLSGAVSEVKNELVSHKEDYANLNNRVEQIITTPVDGVSAQEIIDARDGKVSLGANLTAIKNLANSKNGVLGSEMLINGNFDDSSNWVGENWSFANGKAQHTAGKQTSLSQSILAIIGKTYKIEYIISDNTAGNVRTHFGGVFGEKNSANGVYKDYLTATKSDIFEIIPSIDFNGSIDSVSIKELIGNPLEIDNEAIFKKSIKLYNGISIPDGLPIRIGFEALPINTTGEYNIPSSNIAIGYRAGNKVTTGHITAVGYAAGENATENCCLTAFGKWAGKSVTTAHSTLIGNAAGLSNTTSPITAVGDECAALTTTGIITAVGYYAGRGNVDGIVTAIGHQAGRNCAPNCNMTVIGYNAGYKNTGNGLTAIGYAAAQDNTSGLATAIGHQSLLVNSTGNATAIGYKAGASNTTGNGVFIGYQAGLKNTTSASVMIGYRSGELNIDGAHTLIGYQTGMALTQGAVTAVGHNAASKITSGSLIAIGFRAGMGVNQTNAPVTDTSGILIGNDANRSVPSSTILTNYIGIGEGVLIDKSNQVKIGNNNIIETILYGTVYTNGDFETKDVGDGFICKSPNGTRHRITVSDEGTVIATAI